MKTFKEILEAKVFSCDLCDDYYEEFEMNNKGLLCRNILKKQKK